MLRFTCPHCNDILSVRDEHLGKRGRCNHCAGRIALIGRPDVSISQMASVVEDEAAPAPAGKAVQRDITEKQRAYLMELGVPESRLEGMSLKRASELIDESRARRLNAEGPTEKQLDYLQRLGAPAEQLAQIRTKGEASTLIEEMHLLPTPEQLAYLKDLGATGAQLAHLRSKGEASVLIEKLRRDHERQ